MTITASASLLTATAERFARNTGQTWQAQSEGHYPHLSRYLARWYHGQLALPRDAEPHRPLWTALAAEINQQWHALRRIIDVTVTDIDAYDADADKLFADLDRGRITVLSTRSTGGHPLWTDETNDRFRAVHDVFGHYNSHVPFSADGEDAAYRSHRLMFSRALWPALGCELRAQNAVLNYGASRGTFAEQICAPVPVWAAEA